MGNHMRNRNINIDTNTIKDIIEYLNTTEDNINQLANKVLEDWGFIDEEEDYE